jgi:hypothetical protein
MTALAANDRSGARSSRPVLISGINRNRKEVSSDNGFACP